MLSKNEFNKLKLKQKYSLLKKEGEFIASRLFTGHNVHLFSLFGFYVEVYRPVGLEYIQWIEVVNSKKRLESYLGGLDIDIDELMGE